MFITSRTSFTSLEFFEKIPEGMLFFLLKIVLFRVLRSAYHKSELGGWTKAF